MAFHSRERSPSALRWSAKFNGRANTREGDPPPGTGSGSILRLGARYTTGPVRADAGLIVGLTSGDPRWGVTAGFTYVFDAFQVP